MGLPCQLAEGALRLVGAMRGLRLFLLATLLATLLCPERALSLQCYTCGNMENSGLCHPFRCVMEGVCYSSNATLTMVDGTQMRYQQKGCAPSCHEASEIMQQLSSTSPPEIWDDPGLWGLPQLKVQGLLCCEEDLCNGGPRRLGPGGGLVLSLGPVLLWALL